MRFHVNNRHNGKRYKAEGQFWPGIGWSVKVYDFAPDAWGRAEDGIGNGPVMDQGWQKDLEQRGYEFPPLTPPADIRGQEMKRLAQSMIARPEMTGKPPCPLCKGGGSVSGKECPQCRGRGVANESRATKLVNRLLEADHHSASEKRNLRGEDDTVPFRENTGGAGKEVRVPFYKANIPRPKINYSQRLAALRKRRGEDGAPSRT